MTDEKAVPTIVLKLTDAERFNVEMDLEVDKLHLMRAMLTEALATVTGMIQDEEAQVFAMKMSQAAAQQRVAGHAIPKRPRII
jgi:hypothetical protein